MLFKRGSVTGILLRYAIMLSSRAPQSPFATSPDALTGNTDQQLGQIAPLRPDRWLQNGRLALQAVSLPNILLPRPGHLFLEQRRLLSAIRCPHCVESLNLYFPLISKDDQRLTARSKVRLFEIYSPIPSSIFPPRISVPSKSYTECRPTAHTTLVDIVLK